MYILLKHTLKNLLGVSLRYAQLHFNYAVLDKGISNLESSQMDLSLQLAALIGKTYFIIALICISLSQREGNNFFICLMNILFFLDRQIFYWIVCSFSFFFLFPCKSLYVQCFAKILSICYLSINFMVLFIIKKVFL